MYKPAVLALEDDSIFHGYAIGAEGEAVGEVVFNTALTGYQEILTDPSYAKQMVALTYPHIGNVGCNEEDEESHRIWATALIVREASLLASNWRSRETLQNYLIRKGVVGIAGIDTRRLTRLLREKGAQRGCIITGDHVDIDAAIASAHAAPELKGLDLAKEVSTTERYSWQQNIWQWCKSEPKQPHKPRFSVVAYDFGVKRNILRLLVSVGAAVTVVPATTSAEAVLALQPDGIFLSNGPGDPEPCTYAIEATKQFLEKGIPVFGICLGHQLLALASGARTLKMKFGHHGANHPVQDLKTGQVMITTQNHGFCVDESTLPENIIATHRSLFDNTLQGIERVDVPAFSFQGHPEASPGPHDMRPLFNHFAELMQAYSTKNQ